MSIEIRGCCEKSSRDKSPFFRFARHGRALTGASPEHAQVVGNVAAFGLVSMLDYYTERCVTC